MLVAPAKVPTVPRRLVRRVHERRPAVWLFFTLRQTNLLCLNNRPVVNLLFTVERFRVILKVIQELDTNVVTERIHG